jgi:hypothetical protein
MNAGDNTIAKARPKVPSETECCEFLMQYLPSAAPTVVPAESVLLRSARGVPRENLGIWHLPKTGRA